MTGKHGSVGFPSAPNRIKTFFCERPPLVVFVACLGSFAVVLMSLSYIINNTNDLESGGLSNITKDWNTLMSMFSKYEFCMLENATKPHETLLNATSDNSHENVLAVENITPTGGKNNTAAIVERKVDFITATINMRVTILPTIFAFHDEYNISSIVGLLSSESIGLPGDANISLHMDLHENWTQQACSSSGCRYIKMDACVMLKAPAFVFPESEPPHHCELSNSTGTALHTHLKVKAANAIQIEYCRGKPTLRFAPKPETTQLYLSEADKTMINLHLMHTSYFVFATMIFFLFYGIIKRKPHSSTSEQKQTLM